MASEETLRNPTCYIRFYAVSSANIEVLEKCELIHSFSLILSHRFRQIFGDFSGHDRAPPRIHFCTVVETSLWQEQIGAANPREGPFTLADCRGLLLFVPPTGACEGVSEIDLQAKPRYSARARTLTRRSWCRSRRCFSRVARRVRNNSKHRVT